MWFPRSPNSLLSSFFLFSFIFINTFSPVNTALSLTQSESKGIQNSCYSFQQHFDILEEEEIKPGSRKASVVMSPSVCRFPNFILLSLPSSLCCTLQPGLSSRKGEGSLLFWQGCVVLRHTVVQPENHAHKGLWKLKSRVIVSHQAFHKIRDLLQNKKRSKYINWRWKLFYLPCFEQCAHQFFHPSADIPKAETSAGTILHLTQG